jgi:hemerythrin-like domain-containing protein
MTEHKTMNTIIHAAFRRDLRRLDTALEQFPAGAQQRADDLGRAWDNLAFQLDHHHEDEETIFWPALRSLGADAAMAEELEGEHAQMLAALSDAKSSMRTFQADPTTEHATAARQTVGRLGAVLTAHLEHEERDMEPISAANHKSPQIKTAQKVVRKAHRGNQGTLFAWLQDGADADARRALRREVPAPVLFVISRTAGRRYNRTIAPVWG